MYKLEEQMICRLFENFFFLCVFFVCFENQKDGHKLSLFSFLSFYKVENQEKNLNSYQFFLKFLNS